jgi:hypothetical protein
MKSYAPIAYFVYNRPDKTKLSIDALSSNYLAKDSDIYIFSDGAKDDDADKKKVEEVRELIKYVKNFKNIFVINREKNIGLYENFTQGITQICNKFGKVIVVEDDNLVSKYFLNYINDGLNIYENETKVCAINGWFFPEENNLEKTFFIKGGDTWGWGTWKRAWIKFNPDTNYLIKELKKRKLEREFNLNNSFNFFKMLQKRHEGLNDSHTIIWKASTFLEGMLSLHPSKSLVKNFGFDGSGTHSKNSDSTHVHKYINEQRINMEKIEIQEDIEATKFIIKFYKKKKFFLLKQRIFNKIFRFFGS